MRQNRAAAGRKRAAGCRAGERAAAAGSTTKRGQAARQPPPAALSEAGGPRRARSYYSSSSCSQDEGSAPKRLRIVELIIIPSDKGGPRPIHLHDAFHVRRRLTGRLAGPLARRVTSQAARGGRPIASPAASRLNPLSFSILSLFSSPMVLAQIQSGGPSLVKVENFFSKLLSIWEIPFFHPHPFMSLFFPFLPSPALLSSCS